MLRQITGMSCSVSLMLLGALQVWSQTVGTARVTDVTPLTVRYPNGPAVTVRNPLPARPLQALVIRHLDGAIVRTYQAPALDRWPLNVEITQPGKDRLLELVKGDDVPIPFTLLVVNERGEVEAAAEFSVLVTAPGWKTGMDLPSGPDWPLTYAAKGKYTALKDDALFVDAAESYRFKVAETTEFTKAGTVRRMSDIHTADISAGEHVGIVYAKSQGIDVALLVWSWSDLARSSPRRLMTGARFYIGTVTDIKAAVPKQGGEFIVHTKMSQASMQWLVTRTTEVLSGMVKAAPERITQETLVAVGADEVKGSPIPAVRILLLKDLSGSP